MVLYLSNLSNIMNALNRWSNKTVACETISSQGTTYYKYCNYLYYDDATMQSIKAIGKRAMPGKGHEIRPK